MQKEMTFDSGSLKCYWMLCNLYPIKDCTVPESGVSTGDDALLALPSPSSPPGCSPAAIPTAVFRLCQNLSFSLVLED